MQSNFIFEGSEKFPMCHAGTLCELSNGDLLAAWYAGSEEGAPDSVILGSRLPAGSQDWQPARCWVDVVDHASGNPRVFVGSDGAVWLIAPINYGLWCDGGTRMFLKRSYDLGETWTDLEILTNRRRILGKNKPIKVEPDIWILPVEYEGIGDVAFMRSVNSGKSWRIIDRPGLGAYLDQPTIVQLRDETLLTYMRSWEGYIFETRSYDKGLSWSEPRPTSLLNPNSGIDMVALRSGELALVYNPTALGSEGNLTVDNSTQTSHTKSGVTASFAHEDLQNAWVYELRKMLHKAEGGIETHESGVLAWGPRTPLFLAVSSDDGENWRNTHILEDSEGEYSYPAIIQASNGALHIIYTHNRTRMKHVCIEKSEL